MKFKNFSRIMLSTAILSALFFGIEDVNAARRSSKRSASQQRGSSRGSRSSKRFSGGSASTRQSASTTRAQQVDGNSSTITNASYDELKQLIDTLTTRVDTLEKDFADFKGDYETKEKERSEKMESAKEKMEQNKYLHPVNEINKTYSDEDGKVTLGVGCYEVTATAGRRGKLFSAPLSYGVARAFFCISKDKATLEYYNGNKNNLDTEFTVDGAVDEKFSGIKSGRSIVAKFDSSKSCEGLVSKSIPDGYSSNDMNISSSIVTSTNKKLSNCGTVTTKLFPGIVSNGSIAIKTVKPTVALY